DFLSRLDGLGELRGFALRASVVLGPLSPEGLRQAIREPARRCGVELEPALVDELARDADRGSLSLLSFALARLSARRDPAAAWLAGGPRAALGGLDGARAAHADAVLAGLAPDERAEARRLLVGLVALEGTRARRVADELLLGSPAAGRALAALVDGRLVV